MIAMHDNPSSILHAAFDAIDSRDPLAVKVGLQLVEEVKETSGDSFVREQIAAYQRENYRVTKLRDRVISRPYRVS